MDRLEICDKAGTPAILIDENGDVVDLKKETVIYQIGNDWVVKKEKQTCRKK